MSEAWQPARKRGMVNALARLWSRGEPAAAPPPKVAPPHPLLNNSIVDCALYVDGIREPGRLDFAEALAAASRYPRAFVWLGLHEPDATQFTWVAEVFGLHELAVEEATSKAHRPKIEQHGEHVRFVLRTARYVEHAELNEWSEVVETGHIVIFIGPRFVITVRHGAPGALKEVRAHLEKRRKLLALGPWSVAYAICDRLVDTYLGVAEEVENDVNKLEEVVFARDRSEHIAHIYQLKRELMEFRRAVFPLQRPMSTLTQDRTDVPNGLRRYFRDVADHLSRCVDQITTYDELLNSILQARLAQVTVDQNNDMRKIAAYAAMAAVQTAIAGIYGMNFRYMPELEWKYGYPGVLLVMAAAALLVYRLFRRSGWL
jgi:magnesium transporter